MLVQSGNIITDVAIIQKEKLSQTNENK